MKKNLIVLSVILLFTSELFSQVEYTVITTVESIVPNGLGRSRMISVTDQRDYIEFTSKRSEDKDEDEKNKSDRGDIRVKDYEETKLLNFYNLGGIRFQNIAANDAVITSKINSMSADGWELTFVVSGVESDAGDKDGQGIFITRYIFKRLK